MTELSHQVILEAVKEQREWTVKHLQDLVRIPTVLGAELQGQEYIADLFEEVGFTAKLLPVDIDKIQKHDGFSPVDWSYENRPNLVGIQKGYKDSDEAALIFNGHIDVVSPEPTKLWRDTPYSGVVRKENGTEWLYGRGAGDMKGGSMCFVWALKALKVMGLEPEKPVQLHSPIEEECTGNGALSILEQGYHGQACVIPEPFSETILTNQVGVMWFQVRILGKTTHVLGAGRGINAIEKSWTIINAMRELETELNRPENIPSSYKNIDHPINLNVGTINGGDWASTVAGECVTRFRLGLFPGEKAADLRAKIEQKISEASQGDEWFSQFPPQIEYIGFQAEGCHFPMNCSLGQSLNSIHENWRGNKADTLDATCTTDVRFYNLYYDTPATCYGPHAKNIHGVDECVNIDSMQRVSEVFVSLIEKYCGLKKRSSS